MVFFLVRTLLCIFFVYTMRSNLFCQNFRRFCVFICVMLSHGSEYTDVGLHSEFLPRISKAPAAQVQGLFKPLVLVTTFIRSIHALVD